MRRSPFYPLRTIGAALECDYPDIEDVKNGVWYALNTLQGRYVDRRKAIAVRVRAPRVSIRVRKS